MPLKGVRCVRGVIPMSEHLRCQLEEAGPPCLVPPTILRMIVEPSKEREDLNIEFSPSSLSSCHRRKVLSKDNDYFIDIKAMYKPVRGSIFHQGLEHEPPPPGTFGVIRELRMSSVIDTVYGEKKFWGKADEITLLSVEEGMLHVKITDLKTKSEVTHELIEAEYEHVIQINMYAWLIKKFLPTYLHSWRGYTDVFELEGDGDEHLFLNPNWPITLLDIDEVIVDELSITYADMKRTRIFTSRGFLYDSGKIRGEIGIDGRWRRTYPIEHDELELAPIHMFANSYIESKIRKGIEEQIESETLLAPPLTGVDANIQCGSCPVRQACITLGKDEGYNMAEQERFG